MEGYFYRGQLNFFREIEFDLSLGSTVWKFENLTATKNLREIKDWDSRS